MSDIDIIPVSSLSERDKRIGKEVKIAAHIGHAGNPFPLHKTGKIVEVYHSSVIVVIEGDSRRFQVTHVFK